MESYQIWRDTKNYQGDIMELDLATRENIMGVTLILSIIIAIIGWKQKWKIIDYV